MPEIRESLLYCLHIQEDFEVKKGQFSWMFPNPELGKTNKVSGLNRIFMKDLKGFNKQSKWRQMWKDSVKHATFPANLLLTCNKEAYIVSINSFGFPRNKKGRWKFNFPLKFSHILYLKNRKISLRKILSCVFKNIQTQWPLRNYHKRKKKFKKSLSVRHLTPIME